MATVKFKDGDAYLVKLSRLEMLSTQEVCGAAVYAGAEVVTDSIRESLAKVPTDSGNGGPGHELQGPSKKQKDGMIQSLGIAPMQDDGSGYVNVKVGFDGYNDIKTKRWPNGQPNQMVARAVERGTSFMVANPFVKKGVAAARKLCLERMREAIDDKIEKIMKG